MKTLLFLLVFSALLFIGCTNNSSDLTSPDAQITQQLYSPNWIKLPADLEQGFGVETEYSAEKLIKGKNGGYILLDFVIHRPGNELGDFTAHAKVKVRKNSFPAQEYRTFTVSLDPEYLILNITPSPSTLDKQLVVDLYVKGIDVSQINPDTFSFIFVGDNTEILNTESESLLFNSRANWIKVMRAEIIAPTDETPSGARYAFTR
ncbi:MAG: hypothetical protein IH950_06385 [Bacteroidetes bacterium]|nr:hypothetical protein [Bacteroidota bacterium]